MPNAMRARSTSRPWRWTPPVRWSSAGGCRRSSRSRARSIPCCCAPAARRWTRRVDAADGGLGRGPWIFNLGHGILPDVPIAHVEQVLEADRRAAVSQAAAMAAASRWSCSISAGRTSRPRCEPFLFNLFSDPAIIGLPGLVRTPLARLISTRRETSAQANYAMMARRRLAPAGGDAQNRPTALEAALAEPLPGDEVRAFIAMRYWQPLTEETARDVAAFGPDEVVLLPLYPQFSTTTTASSLKAWTRGLRGPGPVAHRLLLSRRAAGWIEAQAQAHPRRRWPRPAGTARSALLFSAHGIPEKLVGRRAIPIRSRSSRPSPPSPRPAESAADWSDLLPEPGRADEMAGALDARGHRAGRPATASAWSSPRSPSSPSTSRPWSSSTSNTPNWPHELGVAPYLRAPTVGVAARLHRRSGRGGGRARLAATGRRALRPGLPGRLEGLSVSARGEAA